MPTLFADTHVHLYPRFDVDVFLDAALRHFDAHGAASPDSGESRFLLCLTDPCGLESDRRLAAEVVDTGAWRFAWEDEGASVRAVRRDGRCIDLLPGRQLVSAEKLEALALGCRVSVQDRTVPIAVLLDRILEAGGVPVLPWSFGKWMGARGRVILELLEKRTDFFLADNGNRWPEQPFPTLLRRGAAKGLRILSGSDPLPLEGEDARVGSCGIRARVERLDLSAGEVFRAAVAGREWQAYRTRMSGCRFVGSMVRMQMGKGRPLADR